MDIPSLSDTFAHVHSLFTACHLSSALRNPSASHGCLVMKMCASPLLIRIIQDWDCQLSSESQCLPCSYVEVQALVGCGFHLFEVCFSVAFLFLYLSPTVVVWSWVEQSLKYHLNNRAFAHFPHNAPHHHSDHLLRPNLPSCVMGPCCSLLQPMPSLFNGTPSSLLKESLCSPDFTVKLFLMEKVSDQSHFSQEGCSS